MALPEAERHFSELPHANIQRSKFNRPQSYKGSGNFSYIYPVYVDTDIMPGDTVSLDMGSVIRMTTPIFPTLDQGFVDFTAFFVPHRLVWNHWKEFWGENNSTYWEQPTEYTVPYITSPSGGWDKGSLADYFGIPTKVANLKVDGLAFRAYCKIFEDWWRDENLKQPAFYNTDDTNLTGKNVDGSYDYVTYTQLGAKPLKAAKFHDRFTSALPAPQKGPSVRVPLGSVAPVYAKGIPATSTLNSKNADALTWSYYTGSTWTTSTGDLNVTTKAGETRLTGDSVLEAASKGTPSNLIADLSSATSATINELRLAYSVQRYLEAIARSGSRYIEIIKGIFNVTSPDARLQRSEYIWGTRVPINIDQVLQTSSTDATSPQGNTAAFSCTVNGESAFTKSFTEHGTLMILMCARHHISYQQGLNPMWSRRKRTDWYVPQFSNIGEMPIYNREIYAQGDSVVDSDGNIIDAQVFGYQEAWSELRYNTDIVVGALRSNASGTLDSWHYADNYASLPTLGSAWIDADEKMVDRTLAVPSTTEDQFIFDLFFDFNYTRPLPMYSIPQISDHY